MPPLLFLLVRIEKTGYLLFDFLLQSKSSLSGVWGKGVNNIEALLLPSHKLKKDSLLSGRLWYFANANVD
jgi:hypothetical protein